MDKQTIERNHREMLWPCVRVRAKKAGGSGTVLYSKPHDARTGEYETYVLTNHHVVEDSIALTEKWSSLLQKNVKVDVRSTVDVEFFKYRWNSRAIGGTAVQADIMCYDKDQDIALLRLRDPSRVEYVARMYPRDQESDLAMFMPVYAIGAALGHAPIVTEGMICGFGDEIDNYEYWLSSAQIIFGNSGGAVFLGSSGDFIGVPSRVAVSISGFSASPITHMGWFIPITRIYQFLEDQIFQFIFDSSYTSSQCEELRRKKREQAEREEAKKVKEDDE